MIPPLLAVIECTCFLLIAEVFVSVFASQNHIVAIVSYTFCCSQNPFLDEVFENLQALCNIFVVMPENLKQICSEEPYVSWSAPS